MGNDAYVWEITDVFEKRLKHIENDVDLWEMSQTCLEMAELFDKRLKNVENDLEMGNGLDPWFTTYVFEKRLYCVGSGLKICKKA